MKTTRRSALGLGLAGIAALPLSRVKGAHSDSAETPENRRAADLGNGTFLNPIMAGDHPDPTILKDGADYYMTFSSFEAYPGLIIWHSRDLVNWAPVGPALPQPMGIVFAVDLVKHDDHYFIYIPIIPGEGMSGPPKIYVIHATDMAGPWSAPVDLNIAGYIDPGHIVGEDGKRYLFLSGVARVRLSDDGLATDGEIEKVYDGWKYPDDWITEAYALEGPKLMRRGDYFYLISAVGGTSGPPTGHMVIAARSKSVHGPWENCPHNPIVRTRTDSERWWSRGHATLVEGPAGDWWIVYHGYENGYRSLGRQTLLEPVRWTKDGWFRAIGGDLSNPIAKPRGGIAGPHGIPLSDDFAVPAFGTRWNFYNPGNSETTRANFGTGLTLKGKGKTPSDSSPLTVRAGDHAYECSVAMDLIGEATGGLLLFFNDRLFLGMGFDGKRMTTWRGGKASYWPEPAPQARTLHLRIVNDRQIVTLYYSPNGADWTRHGVRTEVSGYNANVIDDLSSLRPAIYAAGDGNVRFRNFRYRALD
jgi:xylan 1,4-beta-xylosidase